MLDTREEFQAVKTRYGFVPVIGLLLLTGCSSGASRAQKSAYKSQSKVHQERLKLVDEYKKCLDKAGDENAKVEACDSYLKAAEALK